MNKPLTTKEAAARLNISDARVRQLILAGQLKAEKFGNTLLIDETDLKAFLVQDRKPGRPKKEKSDPQK